jgi:hypothetical protein
MVRAPGKGEAGARWVRRSLGTKEAPGMISPQERDECMTGMKSPGQTIADLDRGEVLATYPV